jgi:tetratricopeptide (TPR) repeat protein
MRAIALLGLVPALAVASGRGQAQAGPGARAWQDTVTIPTSVEEAPDPNPPFGFFQPDRVNYPYTMRDHLTDRRVPRTWRALYLENEYLKCIVLPDLGGHLYGCQDKVNGAEVFYANRSIKLTKIGYRGAWAALGVEFNFPVSHNWMSTSPVDFALTSDPDGAASVWVGNVDRVTGMQWRVRLTLRPGRAVLEQRTTLFNRDPLRHRFYWWTNAAVRVWDDTRIIYPMKYTASHGFADVDTWPVDARGTDNSVVGNHRFGPVSRFAYGSREPWMAVYHPRTNAGVVHWSSPLDLPAKKIWSWGGDASGLRWRRALSDDGSAYVEVQRGLFRDQETYGFLEPRETVAFTECWVPIRDLGWVSQATPDAVVSMRRVEQAGRPVLELRLNVTRRVAGATIGVTDGPRVRYADTVTMTPERTWSRMIPTSGSGAPLTFTLRDAGGELLLSHTEGVYDYWPDSLITVGPQAAHQFAPPGQRSEGEALAFGELEEREGRLLIALASYRDGLARSPASLPLLRAAGRLAVALKQYEAAAAQLTAVLERVSDDYESAYYLGLAEVGRGDTAAARRALEIAQGYGRWRTSARFELAGLSARAGRLTDALTLLETVETEAPEDTRAGGLAVALLRRLGGAADARRRLARLTAADPTAALLRYEAVQLEEGGAAEPLAGPLWRHLAADPERIIEIAVDYIRFGLLDDALDLLSRDYPAGPAVVAEPGMPSPASYPLIAYYRGYARQLAGGDGAGDFATASRAPTTYVFPNRPETFPVLRAALARDARDATAHFLLGSLFLSGGMADSALAEWELARALNPRVPTLHRNMGYAVLYGGGPLTRAEALFREGMRWDSLNAGLYFGLDSVLRATGRSASERADALLAYPDRAAMPAPLVYLAARTLAQAGRFGDAEGLLERRFFPSEEGGVNPRDVYLDVRVAEAQALAKAASCRAALAMVATPVDRAARLTFADDELRAIAASPRVRQALEAVRAACAR